MKTHLVNNQRQAKAAAKQTSRRVAMFCALLLQFVLLINIAAPVFAAGNGTERTPEQQPQQSSVNKKLSPEVRALLSRYREEKQKDRLRVIISTREEASAELQSALLSVDYNFSTEKDSKGLHKLAGEVALDDVERIAGRADVVRISLDSRKREWETGMQDAEVAQVILSQKVAPEIQTLVEGKSEEDLNRTVRVIIQTTERPQASLKAEARVIGQDFKAFDGVVAELPLRQVKELALRDDVAQISLDNETEAATIKLKTTTGRNEMIAREPNLTGAGIGIAILDSGVDSSRLSNRVVASANFVTGESTTNDLNGHGTMVAGLAAGDPESGSGGVAPAANIINVRVLNKYGAGLTSDAIRGLEWAIQKKSAYNIRVINMSLGARSTASFMNDPLCKAVRKAVNAGIVVVASAGNYGMDAQGR
ncbi:MAG: S8 family serine peptidase, partial [Acidobacteria bacterium]|nr:S8 family serine peptidase [Acidobacteriota bacterium]